MKRRRYTEADDALLRRLYPTKPTSVLAQQLGRTEASTYQRAAKLGLHKAPEYMTEHHGAAARSAGKNSRFVKGQRPWNSGMSYQAGGRSKDTQFKPRNRPHTWRPVGTYGVMDGYLRVKVKDDTGSAADWRYVHHLVWEAAHGPIPAGLAVTFKTGAPLTNPAEITVDKLELVTRADLMRKNSAQRHGIELFKLSQLRGCITRQINRRVRATEAA